MALPFAGGRVRFAGGEDCYPNGKAAWRCSACGKVGPWSEGCGGYWCLRDEDDGVYADNRPGGYPFWCSPDCAKVITAAGFDRPLEVTRKPRRKS